jgi:hypothetical protein
MRISPPVIVLIIVACGLMAVILLSPNRADSAKGRVIFCLETSQEFAVRGMHSPACMGSSLR